MANQPDRNMAPLILDSYPPFEVEPTEQHLVMLEELAQHIADSFRTNTPMDVITINGFSVQWGDDQNTEATAQLRAQHVERELSRRLATRNVVVEQIRFFVRGLGASQPRVSNSTQQGRKLNRRVEIVIGAPDGLLYETLSSPLQRRLQRLKIELPGLDFAKPSPDAPPVNLTGSYAADYTPDVRGYKDSRIGIHINQAGTYLKIWYTRYVHEPRASIDNKAVRMTGALHGEGSGQFTKRGAGRKAVFGYSIKGDERFAGEISVRLSKSAKTWTMVSGKWKWDFVRQNELAQISDRGLDAIPDASLKDKARSLRNYPYLQEELTAVFKTFVFGSSIPKGSEDSLLGLIRSYVARPSMPFSLQLAASIDKRFSSHVFAEFSLMHMPAFNRWLMNELGSRSLDDERTYLEWLYIIVSKHRKELRNVSSWFSFGQPSAMMFEYRWEFVGLGGGGHKGFFGGKLYTGEMRIKRVRPANGKWSEVYHSLLGGLAIGLSLGKTRGSKRLNGTLTSRYEWSPATFPGSFMVSEGNLLSINDPMGGHSIGKTTVEFFGDGKLPALTGEVEHGLETGFGIGLGPALLFGEVFADGQELKKRVDRIAIRERKVRLDTSYGSAGLVHFGFDQATLTDEGRQALREMLATHLAVFRNPTSVLQIDGHASPKGDPKYNTALSLRRAINVLQAIDDILGQDFGIKDDNVTVRGWGEEHSSKALKDKNVDSADWRRVDIELDGKLVMTLKAP